VPRENIRFEVTGDVQYSRAFEMLAEEASDLSEPFRDIGTQLISSVHENFRTEGAHGVAGGWKELSPAYAEWKRQQVGNQPILVFTGRMRAAMIDPSSLNISPRRLVYEPDAPDYAIQHQDPTVDGHPPQRKMVSLPMDVRRSFDRVFVEWVNAMRSGPIGVSR
jgi:hypothetical protein